MTLATLRDDWANMSMCINISSEHIIATPSREREKNIQQTTVKILFVYARLQGRKLTLVY